MKTWIVSSLDEETIQGEETIQAAFEIRNLKSNRIENKPDYVVHLVFWCDEVIP